MSSSNTFMDRINHIVAVITDWNLHHRMLIIILSKEKTVRKKIHITNQKLARPYSTYYLNLTTKILSSGLIWFSRDNADINCDSDYVFNIGCRWCTCDSWVSSPSSKREQQTKISEKNNGTVGIPMSIHVPHDGCWICFGDYFLRPQYSGVWNHHVSWCDGGFRLEFYIPTGSFEFW